VSTTEATIDTRIIARQPSPPPSGRTSTLRNLTSVSGTGCTDGNAEPRPNGPAGWRGRSLVRVLGGVHPPPGHSSTMKAVTMPYMPSSVSAWVRMWQWKTHAPTCSAVTSTEYRSPGATLTVSAQ
jgi:hypothetical protein